MFARAIAVVIPIFGYAIMKTLTPSPEEILQKLPEHERQAYYHRQEDRKRKQETEPKMYDNQTAVSMMLKQNFQSNRPAWDPRPVDRHDVNAMLESQQTFDSEQARSTSNYNQGSKFYGKR